MRLESGGQREGACLTNTLQVAVIAVLHLQLEQRKGHNKGLRNATLTPSGGGDEIAHAPEEFSVDGDDEVFVAVG